MWPNVLLYLKTYAPFLIKEHIVYIEFVKLTLNTITQKSIITWERDMTNFGEIFQNVKNVMNREAPADLTMNEKIWVQHAFQNLMEKQLTANQNNIADTTKVLVFHLSEHKDHPHLWFNQNGQSIREDIKIFLSQVKLTPDTSLSLDDKRRVVEITTRNGDIKETLRTIHGRIQNTLPSQKSIEITEGSIEKERIITLNRKNVIILTTSTIAVGVVGIIIKKALF